MNSNNDLPNIHVYCPEGNFPLPVGWGSGGNIITGLAGDGIVLTHASGVEVLGLIRPDCSQEDMEDMLADIV